MLLIARHQYANGRNRWVTIVEYVSGKRDATVAKAFGKNKGEQYEAPLSELSDFRKMEVWV